MTKHWVSDCCFVCGARFTDSDPPGTANKELHHVVPRAYGGTNGPLVSLCDSCHSKVHKLSTSLDLSVIPKEWPPESQSRLKYLATVIYNSKKISNDPNKLLPISFKINKVEAQKVDALKPILNVSSRSAVYKIALERLFINLLAQK